MSDTAEPLGRRIEKTVNGDIRRYIYDNEDIIAVLDGNNTLLQTFTHGPGIDEPLIMTGTDGGSYYYHADTLGSITALTDDKGETAQTIKYQSYGKPVIVLYDQAAAGNPYLFTAREFDPESELYYYRARYYDWRRGAFTQEDPIGFKGRDFNLYRYVVNAPVHHVDPYGTVIPLAVYPILAYTLWDAALNSTYVETKDGGVLTIPPPILWSTALPGLVGVQITLETKEYKGILLNLPMDIDILIPKPSACPIGSSKI